MLSRKVIITGSFGVGKTSLFNRFVYARFDEKYLTTIGVKVDKRTVEVDDTEISLLLWDIAGEVRQDKVPKSYFLGAAGIIYVFDLSRPSTYDNLAADLEYLRGLLPDAKVMCVGNKADLLNDTEQATIQQRLMINTDYLTSAKTGENVEQLFYDLAKTLVNDVSAARPS